MRNITESEKEIPVVLEVDVIVAGAGPAGFAAALAAARNGADVLLVETENYIGGLLTCLPILGYYNYQGEQVIFGIAQELIDRLIEKEGSPGHIIDPRLTSVTVVDTEILKIVAQEMIEESCVRVLFHTIAASPILENGIVKGLILENKSGRQAVLAKVVVDATGDGDISARAGAEFEIKDKDTIQPGNLMFRMDHVNTDKIRLAVAKNPDLARLTPGFGSGADYYLNAERFVLDGFTEQLKEARLNGDIPSDYPMHWVIIVTQPREDEVAINMAMAVGFHSTDAAGLSRAEIEGRRRIPLVVKFLKKYIPGFEQAELISSHSIMGVRESRRIMGDYVLSEDDVMNNRSFKDGVAIASWGLSAGHQPKGNFREKEYYTKQYPREHLSGCEVPYRCLLPRGIEGLLTSGRCISVTGLSQNAIRVMAPCMSIGQAAGTAAALASKSGISPRQVDPIQLRKTLQSQGVRLLSSD